MSHISPNFFTTFIPFLIFNISKQSIYINSSNFHIKPDKKAPRFERKIDDSSTINYPVIKITLATRSMNFCGKLRIHLPFFFSRSSTSFCNDLHYKKRSMASVNMVKKRIVIYSESYMRLKRND